MAATCIATRYAIGPFRSPSGNWSSSALCSGYSVESDSADRQKPTVDFAEFVHSLEHRRYSSPTPDRLSVRGPTDYRGLAQQRRSSLGGSQKRLTASTFLNVRHEGSGHEWVRQTINCYF